MITERIDAITKLRPEQLLASPPAPKSVKIELTGRCNYRCSFCALRTRDAQPNLSMDMDFDLFKRMTMEMRNAGVEEIGCFYLGEPFMAPELLVKAISYLKDVVRMPYVFLTSNASLAFSDHVLACMEAGLDSMKWSVNAADHEQFESIMGVKGSLFDQAMHNIKIAHFIRNAGGHKTKLYASSIQYDGEQQKRMEDTLDKFVRPFVDQHYWLPLYQMSMNIDRVKKETGFTPTAGNMGRIGALRNPLPCWSAFSEGHVRADGHLSVCCFGSDERFDAGDLNDQSFTEAWNSAPFKLIREAQLRTVKEGPEALKGTMCEVCSAWS